MDIWQASQKERFYGLTKTTLQKLSMKSEIVMQMRHVESLFGSQN